MALGSKLLFVLSVLASLVSGIQDAQLDQHPIEMADDTGGHVRIVQRPASADILDRYNNFLHQHRMVLHIATAWEGPGPGYCLSLALFQPVDGAPEHWGLLVSYETMKEEVKHVLGRFFENPRQTLDPTTDRFVYAFAPRLRWGRLLSDRGNITIPKITDDNAPSTLVGALYTSEDPRHSGAMATIGGVVLGVNYREERKYYGLTLATVWDGKPKTPRPDAPRPDYAMRPFPSLWQSPPLDRGETEVVLEPVDDNTTAIIGDDAELVSDHA